MLDTLKKIVEGTPGAKAAILMGFDGISVEQFVAEGSGDPIDIESTAMEFISPTNGRSRAGLSSQCSLPPQVGTVPPV